MQSTVLQNSSAREKPSLALVSYSAISGIAAVLNVLAQSKAPRVTWVATGLLLLAGAAGAVLLFWAVQRVMRTVVYRLALAAAVYERYVRRDDATYAVFTLTTLGAVGFYVPLSALMLFFFLLQIALICHLAWQEDRASFFSSPGWLAFLFLISGFAALIYQIAWQRVLFTMLGVNIESITIIVSIFMLGLGIGAILGGQLSARWPERLPMLFLGCEVLTGLFGIFSIPLIKSVSTAVLHQPLPAVTLAIYALLAVPILLMGATLPILVSHSHRVHSHVGTSIGLLYGINAAGAAIACFTTTDIFFSLWGLQAAVFSAVCCNFAIGFLVYCSVIRAGR